jgi:hypothetical protein
MRRSVLVVTLVFIALLAAVTIEELVRQGVTAVSILAVLIIVLFAIGIVGALRNPPSE